MTYQKIKDLDFKGLVGKRFNSWKQFCEENNVEYGSSQDVNNEQKQELLRFCELKHSNNFNLGFTIKEVYEFPKPNKSQYNDYDNLPNGKGVYYIVDNDKNIYVGSTTVSFKHRYMGHMNKNNNCASSQIVCKEHKMGTLMDMSDIEDEWLIRAIESEFITYFEHNWDFHIINKIGIDNSLPEASMKTKSVKSINETQLYIKEEIGTFFFYFFNELEKIDIPPAHKFRFLYLSTFLDYGTENLVTKIEGKGNVYFRINKKRLRYILKLSDSELSRTMKSLMDINMVYKEGEYFNINTKYSTTGRNYKTKETCFVRVFKNSIKSLYETVDFKQHKTLYYLFKILPYINKENNVLCEDRNVSHVCNTQALTMYKVWGKLGMDAQNGIKVYDDLRNIELNGEHLITKLQIADDEFIAINPRLYYAGDDKNKLELLLDSFKNQPFMKKEGFSYEEKLL